MPHAVLIRAIRVERCFLILINFTGMDINETNLPIVLRALIAHKRHIYASTVIRTFSWVSVSVILR